jgi:hypothetical protein
VEGPAHIGDLLPVKDVEEHVAKELKLTLEKEGDLAVGDAGQEFLRSITKDVNGRY